MLSTEDIEHLVGDLRFVFGVLISRAEVVYQTLIAMMTCTMTTAPGPMALNFLLGRVLLGVLHPILTLLVGLELEIPMPSLLGRDLDIMLWAVAVAMTSWNPSPKSSRLPSSMGSSLPTAAGVLASR